MCMSQFVGTGVRVGDSCGVTKSEQFGNIWNYCGQANAKDDGKWNGNLRSLYQEVNRGI